MARVLTWRAPECALAARRAFLLARRAWFRAVDIALAARDAEQEAAERRMAHRTRAALGLAPAEDRRAYMAAYRARNRERLAMQLRARRARKATEKASRASA